MQTINLNPEMKRALSNIACNNIDILLDELGVQLYRGSNNYYGKCPIHGGKKVGSLNLYTSGHTTAGNYRCFSKHCHDIFMPTIIGFTHGVLSHQEYNWQCKGDKTFGFWETINFLMDLFKVNHTTLEINAKELAQRKPKGGEAWSKPVATKTLSRITRQHVRKTLVYPCEYFINRGFSHEVLDKYDVGLCDTSGKPMYARGVAPVYDEDYKYLVGCTGRSIYEKCSLCDGYHGENVKCVAFPKWKNNSGFQKRDYLYGYWFSKEYIKQSKQAILVESPGNLWRLDEAGINNAVALFGSELSDSQAFLLEKLGVSEIILIMDNDEAGQKAAQKMIVSLSKFYKVTNIVPSKADIAEMSAEEVNKFLTENNIGRTE